MRRRQVLLTALCLFAVALVPRAYVAWTDQSELLSDERTYDKYAWSFALDEPRVEKGKQIYHPLGSFTYRPPGYPLFLGLIYRLRGHSYRDARMVQALLGAMTCTLVYLIGEQTFGFQTGVLAGLLTAIYGLLIQFTRLLLSETLFLFLICGFALLLLRGIRHKAASTAVFFVAGIVLGLAAITRPVGLPIGLLTFLFFPVGLRAKHGRLKAGLAFALGLLLVVGVVTIRNYQIQGALIPISTHGGITFWRGVLQGDAVYPPELVSLRERIGDLPELEQQRLYYQAAINFLRSQPQVIPGILLDNVKLLLVYTTYTVSHKRLTVAMDPCFWYFLLGFGILGALVRARKLLLEKAVLIGIVLAQVATALVYDSSVRNRVPLLPFLALLAAYALVTIVQWIVGVVRSDGTSRMRVPPNEQPQAESTTGCRPSMKRADRTGLAILLFAGLVLLGGLLCYAYRIDKWMAYDDEGGYLYAAWRISLGELPYRDFLTPQLPVFLYPGALVLKGTGYSVVAARLSSAVYSIAAAWLLFLTLRRVWGSRPALLGLALFVAQRDVFWAGRFFRPEAPMLFWSGLGSYLFVRGYPSRHRRTLAFSGVAFGLSTMSKLFGALSVAGIGLFLLVEAVRERKWRDATSAGLVVGIPFVATVAAIGGLFWALTPNFLGAVLGHHLRQGSGTPFQLVLLKRLVLYRDYATAQPLYVLAALAGVLVSFRRRERIGRMFAYCVPTAFSFLLITRSLQGRHLTYLVPSLAGLAALTFNWIWDRITGQQAWGSPRALAGALIGGGLCLFSLWPHVAYGAWVASWEEHTTESWTTYIQSHTGPDDFVMSDYPGVNFFARRRTTPIAAGISRGAALSGQIMGSDLIREIKEYDVQMVLLNVAQGSHQFVNLPDYLAFKQYVQTHFHLSRRAEYDYRLVEVYSREDLWEGNQASVNFGNAAKLSGVRWLASQVAPGESLQVALRWQALAPMPEDYLGTLTLVDGHGRFWGLGSKLLADVDKDTYWDEEGLERAVLIPTSRWPVAEATIQTFELPVDLATPPGAYSVRLRAHPEGTWNGLPVIDVAGAASGYDVRLGQVQVLRAQSPPDLSLLSMDHRLDLALAPGLLLVGHSSPPSEARPGDSLGLSMVWQALGEGERPCQLQLSLRGEGQTWGEVVTSLVRSDFPPMQWQDGEVLRGQYDLIVDAETPAGEYELWAKLLDEGGQPVGSPRLAGRIKVAGRERLFQEPHFEHEIDAQFGGAATLLGCDLPEGAVKPGETISSVLYWRGDQRMSVAYTVFVHLIDQEQRVWAQQDSQPVQGTHPTTGWLPGEVIVDEYVLRIPEDAPHGTYWIEVGLYHAATGRRLPGTDAQGNKLESDRILLSEVVVSTD